MTLGIQCGNRGNASPQLQIVAQKSPAIYLGGGGYFQLSIDFHPPPSNQL